MTRSSHQADSMAVAFTPEFPPKAEFRKWLRSLPADEVVAQSWGGSTCPLAVWLFKTGFAEHPYISPGSDGGRWSPSLINAANSLSVMPRWANAFGRKVDRLGIAKKERQWVGPVTAADCLRVLARTPKE